MAILGQCSTWQDSQEGSSSPEFISSDLLVRQSYHLSLVLCKKEEVQFYRISWASQVVLVVKNLPANARDVTDVGSIPRSGRSPGGGNSNPQQYSCLENPMDRGAWQATVHKDVKSWTRLKWLSMHIHPLGLRFACSLSSVLGVWDTNPRWAWTALNEPAWWSHNQMKVTGLMELAWVLCTCPCACVCISITFSVC